MDRAKKWIWDIFLWLSGGVAVSVAVNMFSVPSGIILGGLTGLGTVINYLIPAMPVGTAVFAMNVPLFILAKIFLDSSFLPRTLMATAIYTLSIDVGTLFIPAYTGDVLLGCLFCGVLSGLGLALVLLSGATTGGTEIIGTLVRLVFPRISMGRIILIADIVVILCAFLVYGEIENAMYATVIIFISSRVIDFLLYGSGNGKVIFTVTKKKEMLSEAILTQVGRGVTVIPAVGAYSGTQQNVLLCAVKARQISAVIKYIKQTDPESFTVVCDAGEIIGEGFK